MSFTGILPDLYEVWLCRFEFDDKPDVKKVRLAVIVGIDEKSVTVIAAKITSHAPRDGHKGEITITDINSAGLVKESTIRCSQVISLNKSDLIKRLGKLGEADRKAFLAGLVEAGYRP